MQQTELAINSIRFLAVDMVERAGCGHPGAPMGQAAAAYQLWTRVLRHDPSDPDWWNRDRFVLSCGHASALVYALLHLSGYGLTLEDLKQFRQLESRTPGHPEHGLTPGIETTTGPLGQGISNAVGMAIAETMLAARYNREGADLFDYRTWVLASDGDIMEGVASEACSFAGHHRLGKLNVIYDANQITIDGDLDLAFSEDVGKRYEAYGWHVQHVDDGNDLAALQHAYEAAMASEERPSLIQVHTHIGFGSPHKQDTASAHGEALGAGEVEATKKALGWPLEPTFHVPDEAREPFLAAAARGREKRQAWVELWRRYQNAHEDEAAEIERRYARRPPQGWREALRSIDLDPSPLATRKASGKALNAIAPLLPELVGGSADLTGSNNTLIKDEPDYSRSHRAARNMRFGVREHGMGAMMNGMALSGMIRPYGGTFLVFSDYMRPAIRLAALMKLPVIYVFTHDSIFLGEDGPTHQPVGQLAALRAIPDLVVLRPADEAETRAAWTIAIENLEGPTALVLTRQKVPSLGCELSAAGTQRGGYVVVGSDAEEVALIATGSEVALALGAAQRLAGEGIAARVVSLPSWELFGRQEAAYREAVLPAALTRRLGIEAAAPLGWERWVGDRGAILAQETFGASAPYADLKHHFGFTVEVVIERVKRMLDRA